MEVPKVNFNTPLVKRIQELKHTTSSSVLKGDFHTAIEAHKELAKIGLDNIRLVSTVQEPEIEYFNLFSKKGWNALKFTFLNKFRTKTPEEKKFQILHDLYEEYQMEL